MHARSFVSIGKCVVPYDVEQVSGCHFRKALVQEAAAEGLLWHRDGRLQQSQIENLAIAAELLDLESVEPEDLVKGQK